MTTRITSTVRGRRLTAGLLTWRIPFLVALPFYGDCGALLIDEALFKSLMIVIASLCAAVLKIWVFSSVIATYAREAAITGAVWLTMNWGLDLIVLAGMPGMPTGDILSQSDCAIS